jgi:hypothetical protein
VCRVSCVVCRVSCVVCRVSCGAKVYPVAAEGVGESVVEVPRQAEVAHVCVAFKGCRINTPLELKNVR